MQTPSLCVQQSSDLILLLLALLCHFFFCFPLFLIIPLWPAMAQVLLVAVSVQDL